jgi:Ca-activated chloride channel family protein
MAVRLLRGALPFLLLFFFLPFGTDAQTLGGIPGMTAGASADHFTLNTFENMDYYLGLDAEQARRMRDQQEQPSEGVSKLDLKAPSSAKKEFEKGVPLLLHKDTDGAVQHLSRALAIYPNFVAAHNALGTAYILLGRNARALDEFKQAVALDDHLPNSFSNLCRAELALKNYDAAEQAIRKASALAPLNLELSTTLTYTEVLNHNYKGAIETVHQVHAGKHDGAAIVHYLAANAYGQLSNLPDMEGELKVFLAEDAKSPIADRARQMIGQIDNMRTHPQVVTVTHEAQAPTEAMLAAERKQRDQVAEADRMCAGCFDSDSTQPLPAFTANASAPAIAAVTPTTESISHSSSGLVLRKRVDEVALFFAATDHGKSVSDLTPQDIIVRDNHEPPATVLDFRSQGELPLRLGLVVDTSESILERFSFEQDAAASFLRKTLVNPDDLAFVVGFSNTILMVQDFTADQAQISHAVGQLAPAGGTSLWDAVSFAAQKLASRVESQPVARILVVISDGNDNSSKTSLKQAIEAAVRCEVIIYTVSTAESRSDSVGPSLGDRALKLVAEQSGGSAFNPGSVKDLNRGLAELQEVIRSRYLISYKPAHFQPDGRYRSIDISAQKSGRKLRVYARKGYYSRSDGKASE